MLFIQYIKEDTIKCMVIMIIVTIIIVIIILTIIIMITMIMLVITIWLMLVLIVIMEVIIVIIVYIGFVEVFHGPESWKASSWVIRTLLEDAFKTFLFSVYDTLVSEFSWCGGNIFRLLSKLLGPSQICFSNEVKIKDYVCTGLSWWSYLEGEFSAPECLY